MASTGIFHGKSRAIKETLAISRFRAAENRRPLVLAANMGLSYAIDSAGNINSITPNQDAQILTGTVYISPGKTWYNQLGDLPILTLSVLAIGVSIISRKYYLNLKIRCELLFWRKKMC